MHLFRSVFFSPRTLSLVLLPANFLLPANSVTLGVFPEQKMAVGAQMLKEAFAQNLAQRCVYQGWVDHSRLFHIAGSKGGEGAAFKSFDSRKICSPGSF